MDFQFFKVPGLVEWPPSKRGYYFARTVVPQHSRTICFKSKHYYVKIPELVFEVHFFREDVYGNVMYGYDSYAGCCDLVVKTKEGFGVELPNVEFDIDGTVCTGELDLFDKSAISLCEGIRNNFWQTEFTDFLLYQDEEGLELEIRESLLIKNLKKGHIGIDGKVLDLLVANELCKKITLK